MFQALLLNTIYTVARRYFDSGLFDRIEKLVVDLLNQDKSGEEKRQEVRTTVLGEWTTVSGIIVDTIIQIVLLKKTQ